MKDEYLKIYASLVTGLALQRAAITTNPMPHLERAAKRIHELERAIETALLALSGADSFDIAREIAPTLEPSLVETTTVRNEKASATLSAALNNTCRQR